MTLLLSKLTLFRLINRIASFRYHPFSINLYHVLASIELFDRAALTGFSESQWLLAKLQKPSCSILVVSAYVFDPLTVAIVANYTRFFPLSKLLSSMSRSTPYQPTGSILLSHNRTPMGRGNASNEERSRWTRSSSLLSMQTSVTRRHGEHSIRLRSKVKENYKMPQCGTPALSVIQSVFERNIRRQNPQNMIEGRGVRKQNM